MDMNEIIGLAEGIVSSDTLVKEARGDVWNELVRTASTVGPLTKESWNEYCDQSERLYALTEHSDDPSKWLKNGKPNMSKIVDSSYRSAKSTIGAALDAGLELLDGNGQPKKKSELYQETKAAKDEGAKSELEKALTVIGTLDKILVKLDEADLEIVLEELRKRT